MIELNISEEEAKELDYFRYNYPDPRIQKRFDAVRLRSQGYQNKEIAKIVNIHPQTVTEYVKMYKEGGVERLQATYYRKPVSRLDKYAESIKDDLAKNPPRTINEAIARIESLTGIKLKATQARAFMKKLGFRPLRCGHTPAKADSQKQEKFIDESLNPRLEEAKADKRALLFLDSAHFIHAIYVGILWCLSRVFIKSASGRSRFNVLGAIDAINHELFTVCNSTYINANCVCEMLRKLALHYAGKPITIVLDNARYQKCRVVTELARELNIELLYLPSYSPNLNLIERLWKFIKAEVLYCKYYPDFASFKESIEKCLADINTSKKDKVASLLSPKFHILNKEEISIVA